MLAKVLNMSLLSMSKVFFIWNTLLSVSLWEMPEKCFLHKNGLRILLLNNTEIFNVKNKVRIVRDKQFLRQSFASVRHPPISEACVGPSETSRMELFSKIINSFSPLTVFTKNFIVNVWQGPLLGPNYPLHLLFWVRRSSKRHSKQLMKLRVYFF